MEPKIISFTYTKDSGETSKRKLITLSPASTLTTGLDMSGFEGTDADILNIFNEVKDIERIRLQMIYNLLEAVPSIQIKSFKDKNISNSTDITKQYQVKKKETK